MKRFENLSAKEIAEKGAALAAQYAMTTPAETEKPTSNGFGWVPIFLGALCCIGFCVTLSMWGSMFATSTARETPVLIREVDPPPTRIEVGPSLEQRVADLSADNRRLERKVGALTERAKQTDEALLAGQRRDDALQGSIERTSRHLDKIERSVLGLEHTQMTQIIWACANFGREGANGAALAAAAKRQEITPAELCAQLEEKPF